MRRIVDFKSIQLGWPESLLAMLVVSGPYNLGFLYLNLLICFLAILFCLKKKKKIWMPLYFKCFLFYYVVHQTILVFTMKELPLHHINSFINTCAFFATIAICGPAINIKKIQTATYFIAIVASIGIVYHFSLILRGNFVHPIPIPIIGDIFEFQRGDELGIRPVSFFDEPAAYAGFMIVPMYFLLINKKFLWFSAAVFCVLLSTSTTGVLSAFGLLFFYLVLQRKNRKIAFLVIILIGLAAYGLSTASVFESTIEKIESTDIEKSDRMSNGVYIYQKMPKEDLIFGVNASNMYDYVKNHTELYSVITTFNDSDDFYISNLWNMLFLYGYVGLFLYFMIYFKLIRDEILLLPLLGTTALFSVFGGYGLSATFVYLMIASVSLCTNHNKINQKTNESELGKSIPGCCDNLELREENH